jgi:hypothetical protein
MSEQDKKVLFNNLKSALMGKYTSPFNPILWVRSSNCDFYVPGIGKDTIYKIIMPGDRFRINKIIEYWKEKSAFRNFKREIVFIYIKNDFKTVLKEDIKNI